MQDMVVKSVALQRDDIINLKTTERVLQFRVNKAIHVHGCDTSRKKQRITDVQVSVTPVPHGTVSVVLLFPAAKVWTVVRNV